MKLEIKIKEGLGDIRFGMPVDAVVAVLGKPDDEEQIENVNNEFTTVLHYNDLDITLFFEGDPRLLACIDISNENFTLFGEDVFDLGERELVKLMVANNYAEQDVEDEDWGERRVSFPRGNIDFFFIDDVITSIIFGA